MIFSTFEWTMAARYLRARRQEGFISVIAGFSLLGIGLGVATLIIVMAVMNGFRAELLGRILGLNGHLLVQGIDRKLENFDELALTIRGIDGVVRAIPVAEGQVMASANNVASFSVVRGIRPEDLRGDSLVARSIVAGTLDDFAAEEVVVMGARLAGRLGLRIGDRVTLISPQGSATAFGFVPRLQQYRLVATFDIGMYEYDNGYTFMPLPQAQVYFRYGEAVSGIEVMLRDAELAVPMRRQLGQMLQGRAYLFDWQQSNAHFFNALQVERNVMFLILSLIILVAAFNIISSLIMLVKDKGRDIAILRTMGATRGSVMRIFFLSGAAVGVLGTVLGFILGLSFAANIDTIRVWLEGLTGAELFAPEIRFLSRLPAKIDGMEVVGVVLMALGLSFLATVYPSWRAARLDPVEALRYE
ncbi:MAG: lipoprotein-releasing ABC transporter permease subunit [Alphaproteobacteria bacterium]|nr:lipoprotein-releasing ABC transporter permease subunit [Alphaproteobacteria bacterium]